MLENFDERGQTLLQLCSVLQAVSMIVLNVKDTVTVVESWQDVLLYEISTSL